MRERSNRISNSPWSDLFVRPGSRLDDNASWHVAWRGTEELVAPPPHILRGTRRGVAWSRPTPGRAFPCAALRATRATMAVVPRRFGQRLGDGAVGCALQLAATDTAARTTLERLAMLAMRNIHQTLG